MSTLPGAMFLFKLSQKCGSKMHFFKVQFLEQTLMLHTHWNSTGRRADVIWCHDTVKGATRVRKLTVENTHTHKLAQRQTHKI
jgi:hypothetical protein